MAAYNRYKSFIENGTMSFVPFIPIPHRDSDIYIYYDSRKHRLDLISYDYYGDANYDWVILQANPELEGLEFLIPDKTLIRVPFPLEEVISQYKKDIDMYKKTDGFEF